MKNEKIINPCSVIENNKRVEVFCKISLEKGRLSISGVIGPYHSGNCAGSCGQIDTEFRAPDLESWSEQYHETILKNHQNFIDSIQFNNGWDSELFAQFLDIWDKWHLNDLHPECEHQAVYKMQMLESGEVNKRFFYAENLYKIWEVPEFAKCPICGYKYGTSWKSVRVPDEVIDFIIELPHSEKTPAWV